MIHRKLGISGLAQASAGKALLLAKDLRYLRVVYGTIVLPQQWWRRL